MVPAPSTDFVRPVAQEPSSREVERSTRKSSRGSSDDATRELDRQLLIDSREYASENRLVSWWHLASTLVLLGVCLAVAAFAQFLPVRIAGSLVSGLLIVRMFIVYHDYQHNAIFTNSMAAKFILSIYGYIMLTPPSVWRRSHNHHHKNNSKLFGASIGSFPIMTTATFATANWRERLEYRISRNPMVILLGYFTVFMWGMCVRPLVIDVRRHLDAPFSLLVHFGLIAACWYSFGFLATVLLILLPSWVATTAGAYLFYAQHNFPAAKIRSGDEWSYTDAALRSSSFMTMGPIMHWLTGNIGYHHVHHLNAKIPFYRLPEAMEGLPRLKTASTTSLSVADISGCLRTKLWDIESDSFVPFK
jgi:omega-6 fatty acid desaturase (delta-12 desaturase)